MAKDTQGRIPRDALLFDSRNNKWIIKSFTGVSAENVENYTAALCNDNAPTDYSVIVKIEAYKNESLSLSMQFCIDNTNLKNINKYIDVNKIYNGLAMPRLLGSGTHIYNNEKYHFIVMNEYDSDLWKLFVENGKQFPAHTVYKVAFQTIRVLEYIHERGCVHADIKGANLLLKHDHVYLAMSDVMSHYPTKDHQIYPKQTGCSLVVQYSSRDHHIGVSTMRGDLEMLLFNMIQWLCGDLPWDKNLNNPSVVQQMKEDAFEDITKFLQECFKASEVPEPISKFMSLLEAVGPCEEPPYKKFLGVLRRGLTKLGHVPSGSLQCREDESAEETLEILPEATNDNSMDCNNAECEPTTVDEVIVRRSLRLMKKPKQKVATRAQSIKRKIEAAIEERIPRRRKQKTKSAVHKKSQQLDESDEEISIGEENLTRECNLSPCRRSRSCPASPTRLSSSRVRSTSESNQIRRPVSRASSSGFSSHSTSQIIFQSSPGRLFEARDEWLDVPVHQELRVLRDEFNAQQSRLNALANLLAEVPQDWDDADKLNQIAQDWRKQLKERARKLSDTCFDRVRNDLQGISGCLDKLLLNKNTEEQQLHGVEALARQLGDQRTKLANARAMAQKLCQIFNDTDLSFKVQAELRSVDKLYLDLHEKIDVRKSEVDRSFSDKRQFDNSCKELLVWLTTELDAIEKVLVPTDRVMLRQQLENHKETHERVMSRVTKVTDLLKKGHEKLTRSASAESQTIEKRYIDVIQSKWDLLTMRSLKMLNRLQTCFELSEKYHQAQAQFPAWLRETEEKLEKIKPALSKQEDEIKNQLEELSILNNEVREKSGEFEQSTSFADAFLDSCDVDEGDRVKNELASMKSGWRRLNNELLKRWNLLEDTYRQLVGFKKSLRGFKTKLEQYEYEVASHSSHKTTSKDSNFLNRIEKLLEKTFYLQGSLGDLRQRVIGLARKQATDVDHFLDDMNTMTVRIASLNAKLGDLRNKIHEEEKVCFEKETLEKNYVAQEQNEEKPLKLFVPKISWRPEEVIDLVTSDESDMELSLKFEESLTADESVEQSTEKILEKKEDSSRFKSIFCRHDKNNNQSLPRSSKRSQRQDSTNCDNSKYPTTPSSSRNDDNPSRLDKYKYFTDSDDYILALPKGDTSITNYDCRQDSLKNSRKVNRKSDQISNSRRIDHSKRLLRFRQIKFSTGSRLQNINPLSRLLKGKNSNRRLIRKFVRGQVVGLHGRKKHDAKQYNVKEQERHNIQDEGNEKKAESEIDSLKEGQNKKEQRESDFSEMNLVPSISAGEEPFELKPGIFEDIISMYMSETNVSEEQ